jgi:hypothetical protein
MAFGNGTDIHAILPVYDPNHRPATTGFPEVGQFLYTVVPDVGQTWKLFDAERSDQVSHASVSGTIRNVDVSQDYKPKPKRLPVFKIGLSECVELLALTSKMRPCVVLALADDIPDAALPSAQRNLARQAFGRPAALVAPSYTVSTVDHQRSVTATIAARAECLVYPQLAFLPRSGGIIKNDSVLRLDRAFWTTLPPPSELCALSLSKHRQAILHGQMLTLQGQEADEDYLELVELLRAELADVHSQHID